MKKTLYSLVISIIIISSSTAQKTKVLFLGNSYTAANSLADVFGNIAQSKGDTVSYDTNTPGGTRLMDHASNTTSLSLIKQTDWDFVVLQAQSQEPSWPPSQVNNEVYPYAIQLNDSIKANNTCTETVFFMTWGRKNGDSYNCASWPPVCTYLGMQERLMVGYLTMADTTNSTVSPVGMAWKNAIDNNFQQDLYSTDGSHPSIYGTYLTACVMYATMFRRPSTGSNYYSTIGQSDAEFLQNIADSTVLSPSYQYYFNDTITSEVYNLNANSWFDKGNIVIPDFTYNINNNNVSFTNSSLNSTTYLWDFGDGNTSTTENPVNIYSTTGNYLVELETSNSCFNEYISDTISIITTEISEKQDKITIYPNPAKDHIYIKGNNISKVSLHRIIDGKVVCSRSSSPFHLNLNEFSSGAYILKIDYFKKEIRKKIIIN